MAWQTIDVEIRGEVPLVMHNGQLADPMNEWTRKIKEITRKPAKQKTDNDHEEMARLEFMGSLYLDDDGEVCIPGENIESMMVESARKQRLGKQAEAGIMCPGSPKLVYKGPRDPNELWADPQFRFIKGARTGNGRVMRSRARFMEWGLKFQLQYDDEKLDESQFRSMLERAEEIGLCEWIPKYGRFEVVSAEPRTQKRRKAA